MLFADGSPSGPRAIDQDGAHVAGELHDIKADTISAQGDDLARDVYCVLGVPIDLIDMPAVVQRLEAAAAGNTPYFVSTPNLNFLVIGRSDKEFRESLLQSDLCVPDGMPIVWISRLIGLPIKHRITGCDIFQALKARNGGAPKLTTFLFGGRDGVAEAAAAALNAQQCGLDCAGFINPGFGSVDDLSSEDVIRTINASQADFLVVALGAAKGQAWLARNHDRLQVPIRSHFGAAINIQAGVIDRAPQKLQASGFEWLWRIKEEPPLWRRYWHDGKVLLRLLVSRILPLAVEACWARAKRRQNSLQITNTADQQTVTFRLSGAASAINVGKAIACFRGGLTTSRAVVTVDFSESTFIDARFIGLLMMLRKQLKRQGTRLVLTGVPPTVERLFRLHEAGFLLTERLS